MVRKASEVVAAIDDAVEVEDGDADDGIRKTLSNYLSIIYSYIFLAA